MAEAGGIQLVDTFRYSGARYLDLRQHCETLTELKATSETSIPEGFTKYVKETQAWYEWKSTNEETEDTGKWRRTVPIKEELTEEYIYAIVDENDVLLFGIRYDGDVVYNRGMSDEVRQRFSELEGYQIMEDEQYIYAIVDKAGRLLFGIRRDGTIVHPKGIPDEVRARFDELKGYQLMQDETYIYAILDNAGRFLFGIDRAGRVVFDKGIPGEVQKRFDELQGYQVMQDGEFIWAVLDRAGRILLGIDYDGQIYMPKGVVQFLSWEEYEKITHRKDVLYIIRGKGGMTDGAYINDRALSAGEEFAFTREENVLLYRGSMWALPKIWIDYEEMVLMIEYPSNYTGPMFMVDDGILFLL